MFEIVNNGGYGTGLEEEPDPERKPAKLTRASHISHREYLIKSQQA